MRRARRLAPGSRVCGVGRAEGGLLTTDDRVFITLATQTGASPRSPTRPVETRRFLRSGSRSSGAVAPRSSTPGTRSSCGPVASQRARGRGRTRGITRNWRRLSPHAGAEGSGRSRGSKSTGSHVQRSRPSEPSRGIPAGLLRSPREPHPQSPAGTRGTGPRRPRVPPEMGGGAPFGDRGAARARTAPLGATATPSAAAIASHFPFESRGSRMSPRANG